MIYIINALFRGGPSPSCEAAADANGDTMLDLTDATFLIDYLWMGGTPPATVMSGECEAVDPRPL